MVPDEGRVEDTAGASGDSRAGGHGWRGRWKRHGLRLYGCVAGGALAALPVAVVFGVSGAVVKDDVGIVPAKFSAEPGFSSLETGLLAGTIYDRDLTRHGLGMTIELTGPPADLGEIHSLDSPAFKNAVKVYTNMFQHPDDVRDGYVAALEDAVVTKMLWMELETGAALALVAFVVSGLSRRRDWKRVTAGTAGGLLLLSVGLSVHRWVEWDQANQIPPTTYAIGLLAGTPLEGVAVDNKTTAVLIDSIIPLARREIRREKQANEEFVAAARRTIDTEIAAGAVAVPGPGETAVLLLADVHANADMIDVYDYLAESINGAYGEGTLATVFFVGDQTYGGAAAKSAVDAMGQIAPEEYAVIGNHDSQLTIEQMTDAGIEILNDDAVETDSGLTAVGVTDPHLTRRGFLDVTDTVQRPGFEHMSEVDAGRILQDRMQRSDPTLALVHEAYALEPILDKPNISPETMTAWLDAGSQTASPDAGAGPDTVGDIAASAVAYGHWHRRFNYRVVSNDDGTWSVVMELGTAGGAPGELSLTHFSTPQTVPAKTASAVIMIVDDRSNLVTSLQPFTTSTGGIVTAGPIHHIGSADGQPYPTESPLPTRRARTAT